MSATQAGGPATSVAQGIPWADFAGLRPQAWLCVGSGYSREDVKKFLLDQGLGFTGESVTSLHELALRIAGLAKDRLLGSLARQEVLRLLLAEPRISRTGGGMPELKRLRRQAGFFRKLDQAIQGGRLAAAHAEEAAVYDERLESRLGAPSAAREELKRLAAAYEAWMHASELVDPPMLLARAIERLPDWSGPSVIHVLAAQTEEGLERSFWDALGSRVEVARHGPLSRSSDKVRWESQPETAQPGENWRWERWHTLDDAAEALSDRLLDAAKDGYRDVAVLLPDSGSARRSLNRALTARGIPLADPRDPTRPRWEEGIKWAVAPIKTVARGFERDEAVSYLRAYFSDLAELPAWIGEIHSRGVRAGLKAYEGGKLARVQGLLTELDQVFGCRNTCAGLADTHLKFLRLSVGDAVDRKWIVPYFESLWAEFVRDTERTGEASRRAPALYWWERLSARLMEAPSPVERLKPEHGVALFRLSQAPLGAAARVFVLGLPPAWLSGQGVGDYWYSEREREVLCNEFAVRSAISVRAERIAVLDAWLKPAREVTWLDAAYDVDGRERESIEAPLEELSGGRSFVPVECGSHPRWVASYGAQRAAPELRVQLEALPPVPGAETPEITATALDHVSRCGFLGLAYDRWRLKDVREPSTELWPDARGNILHAAARVLLASRDEQGAFGVTPAEALDRAWKLEKPRGLLQSARAEAHARAQCVAVLEEFCQKERDYYSRAPSRIGSLDDARFRLDYDDVSIVGTPDRIDLHGQGDEQGVFVLDYKTSSSLPNGTDMVELGYRLQLPFYALAARRALGKDVLGVQFVELNRKGGRGNGVFFKRYNGKEPGKLTALRANSRSLLAMEPDEAWSRLEEAVHRHALEYAQGRFEARPKKEKDCMGCPMSDFCGLRRLNEREVPA